MRCSDQCLERAPQANGLPILAALFLDITSAVILLMIVWLVLHQATAIASVLGLTLLFEVLPYLEELVRGLRHHDAR